MKLRGLITVAVCISLAGQSAVLAAGSWPRRMGNAQNTGAVAGDGGFLGANPSDLAVVAVAPTAREVCATPVVSDGLLFIGDFGGHLYVYDVSGETPVKLVDFDTGSGGETGGALGDYIGIQSTASIADVTIPATGEEQRRVYVAANQQPNTLYCFNVSAIVAARDSLRATPSDGSAYACDGPWPISLAAPGSDNGVVNGSLLFVKDQPIKVNGVEEVRDVLFAPSTGLDCADGQFYALDALTGEHLWYFDPVLNGDGMGGTVWSNPAMSADGQRLYITTGDCVQKPQVGEKAESLIALDPKTGGILWWHQRRLIDTSDLDIGNSPVVVDVPGEDGCHRIVSTDKDGCIYGFEQTEDIPEVGEPGFDPLRPGQQRILWRTCFVVGSLNGGFNASAATVNGRWAFAQANPPVAIPGDNARAFAVDVCTGDLKWPSGSFSTGRVEGAVVNGWYVQPSGNRLVVAEAGPTENILATVPLEQSVSPGGGGVAIVDGRIYVPLAAGGVAIVGMGAPGSNGSPPVVTATTFKGPYPLPLATAPPSIAADDVYPPRLPAPVMDALGLE